jgi:hypothetical protein
MAIPALCIQCPQHVMVTLGCSVGDILVFCSGTLIASFSISCSDIWTGFAPVAIDRRDWRRVATRCTSSTPGAEHSLSLYS